jgi:hypothetical protein
LYDHEPILECTKTGAANSQLFSRNQDLACHGGVIVSVGTGRRCRLWLVSSAVATQRVFSSAATASPGARLGWFRTGGARTRGGPIDDRALENGFCGGWDGGESGVQHVAQRRD